MDTLVVLFVFEYYKWKPGLFTVILKGHVCIGKNRTDVSGLLLTSSCSLGFSNKLEKWWGFGFFFHFHFSKQSFRGAIVIFLINQTLQNKTSPWLIMLIESFQKSSEGDKGIMAFPNVGIVLERKKLQEKVYSVNSPVKYSILLKGNFSSLFLVAQYTLDMFKLCQSKHLWVVFYLYFGETGASGFFKKHTSMNTHSQQKICHILMLFSLLWIQIWFCIMFLWPGIDGVLKREISGILSNGVFIKGQGSPIENWCQWKLTFNNVSFQYFSSDRWCSYWTSP